MELVVILLLALLVFGPTHLPGLARNLGLWTGRVRGFLGD
ncbi:MAG TPA: twin-arginine translocase TatA/TatE family subunit, partial [Gammaproteobacteria bacterium]|nr:twin-arginine translocase TatA/TatE family subunit [Gammaproteobacteria bacterium]